VTLSELAVTVALLTGLGLAAHRLGMSAIPAYLLAGLLLGPNEPHVFSLIQPSEVTDFVAELGLVFLLFFIGLEFSVGRLARSSRHIARGGAIDLVANGAIGLALGIAAFGMTPAAIVLAACVYVSSSAIAVKGLIDFRRLGDEETDLVLAILVVEDLVVALALGFAGDGGGELSSTLLLVLKALLFITASVAASRWLGPAAGRLLERLSLELFLLAILAFVVGMAAIGKELGLSEAIGALMAGLILAESPVREQIEERFFSFRDVFAALFFFVFGLSIDVGALDTVGVLVAVAAVLTIVGKLGAGLVAGRIGGLTSRQGFNAGAALVAHGEFTIILAQVATDNDALTGTQRTDLVAFAGLYTLVTATVGLILMKESKRIGRRLFPAPTIVKGS
jgi:CPA2 family monovalent cation:H+ antiporter-2